VGGSVKERLAVLTIGDPGRNDSLPVAGATMVRVGDAVVWETRIPEIGEVAFIATDLRRQSTGLHARLQIRAGWQEGAPSLGHDVLNVERATSRKDLAALCSRKLGESRAGKLAEAIRLRLDDFAERVWEVWIGAERSEVVVGDRRARPRWLLEPYVIEGGGTILFGPPGSAKSYLAMIWTMALSAGLAPWASAPIPSLLVNLERSTSSVQWRAGCVGEALGIPPLITAMNRRGRTLASLHDAIRADVERLGIKLVVIDSLSRAGTGSLISDEDTNAAMDMLNGLGASWLVLAHTPRADTSHEYGSVMSAAAADRTVRCLSVTDLERRQTGVSVESVKYNDLGAGRAQVWTLGFDDHDDLVEIRRAHSDEWSDLTVSNLSQEDLIVEYLRDAGAALTSEIAGALAMPGGQVRAICSRSKRVVCLERGTGRGSQSRWGPMAPVALSEG